MSPPPRSLIGNLDVEEALAAWQASERENAKPRPLPPPVRAALAAFSTLLRVFAREGDRLWTLAPVDPARLPSGDGLVVPRLEAASEPDEVAEGSVLAWSRICWSGTPPPSAGSAPAADGALPAPFGLLWRSPALRPEVVRAANHRGFCLAMRAELGVTLPGEQEVDSLSALEGCLAAQNDGDARWVVKAPLSAAGRGRVHSRGRSLDAPARGGVAALLAEQGTVVFEPWMARELDVGCAALLDDAGVRVFGVHRLVVDGGGRFRAVLAGEPDAGGWTPAESSSLRAALEHVGRRLASRGYRGPFGLDAWRYRLPGGGLRFQPLGEVNARLTFGHVAHAYRAHLIARGEIAPGDVVALHLRAAPGSAPPETTAARRVWPLLLPPRAGTAQDAGAAWLETTRAVAP